MICRLLSADFADEVDHEACYGEKEGSAKPYVEHGTGRTCCDAGSRGESAGTYGVYCVKSGIHTCLKDERIEDCEAEAMRVSVANHAIGRNPVVKI